MLNTLFRPKQEAPAKTPGTKAVLKIQTAVNRAVKTLRHDISEYRADLKVAFALDDEDDD